MTSLHGHKRSRNKSRGGLLTAIDVGSTKICCFIARITEDGTPKVIGFSHQVSEGVKSGSIVDIEAATQAIGRAVHAAEQQAGETVRDVVVSLSGVHCRSAILPVELQLSAAQIGDIDIGRALAHARATAELPPENGGAAPQILHVVPSSYILDGVTGVREPRGMFAQHLVVNAHAIGAVQGPVRNLVTCLAQAHLEVEDIIAAPYAAGLSILVEDEMDLGCVVIDIGGGTTEIAVFADGTLAAMEAIPIGGQHVTVDIARGLSTSIAHAERIKTLYGSASPCSDDEHILLDVPQLGEEDSASILQFPKSHLIGIIRPRLEEILELVRHRLDGMDSARLAGRRIVLTGGASQMIGLRELAQEILQRTVRLGRPLRAIPMTQAAGTPPFAVVAGMLLLARQQDDLTEYALPKPHSGFFGKVGQWLKDNL